MDNHPVISTVTDIASSPEEVWKVLTDFAGYAQWHPDLSFVDAPTEVLPGTVLRARLSNGSEIDGEYDFTVLHYEAPRRLAWEGGIPGVVTGEHSFLLDPRDGGTRYTESEIFTGPAAVETVEPNRATMEESSATYGRALKERLESGQ
ncbi:SRPBCC domain-containing protein [Streptomyces canus]|uniref:SRPBCC domain-containing protein n=1 Tax=Streptomyces canus TaxID=58343 RepID=UPI002E2B47D9|nr:SRPBCC domain-containing protein [Streptomyces canus]